MWPKVVANKILRKRLGSNNFVADSPFNSEALPNVSALNYPSYLSTENILLGRPKDTHKYKVFVSTWNVGGVTPQEDTNMEDLLDTSWEWNTACDIYVLGFQEIVPLRASNVLGSENRKTSSEWNSMIREALSKRVINSSSQHKGQAEICKTPQNFQCIISKQMVGIFISVWVRSDLCPFISHLSVSCVGCGIVGCLGNKGSVSVRFKLHETRFCFVCSHLASGDRDGDEKHRNSNVEEIFSRTIFPRGPSLDFPGKIIDHDEVILLGDLNYRISLPEETTRSLVERKEWKALLENDQLRMELASGNMLRGWHEGEIHFAPTYKYSPNSDVYYGCCSSKKTERGRAPAWCDRIIWNGKSLKQHVYGRGELKLSDHRPVKAIFTVEVKVLQTLGGCQSLFWSERFEKIKGPFDASPTDDLLFQSRSSFKV